MRVIARATLTRFVEDRRGHADYRALKSALETWFHVVRHARWQTMADVKLSFRSADPISADRVVFDIKGNSYRLIASLDFEKQIVWILFLGTHSDYDKIDARTVRYVRR